MQKKEDNKNPLIWGGIAGASAAVGITTAKKLRLRNAYMPSKVRINTSNPRYYIMDAFAHDQVIQNFLRKVTKTNKARIYQWRYNIPLSKFTNKLRSTDRLYRRMGGLLAGGVTFASLALLKKLADKAREKKRRN